MKKIYLNNFWSQTVIFDLAQPCITKKEKIRVFWGLTKVDLPYAVQNILR